MDEQNNNNNNNCTSAIPLYLGRVDYSVGPIEGNPVFRKRNRKRLSFLRVP